MTMRFFLTLLLLLGFNQTLIAESFDHSDWTAVLGEVVDPQGMVNYQQLNQNRVLFDRYVQRIETVSPDSNPEQFSTEAEQLAYYLNAYNALVFKGVLARGPEKKSVWRGLISGYNFFVKMDIKVGGTKTNLKKLEDDIIRERFKDPRIHAAINCASISCPRLPQTAFTAAELEQQLNEVMQGFVNSDAHVQADQNRRTVKVSKIFKWFEDDFLNYERANGNLQPKLIHYINAYRSQPIPLDFKLEFLPYNKNINQQ